MNTTKYARERGGGRKGVAEVSVHNKKKEERGSNVLSLPFRRRRLEENGKGR